MGTRKPQLITASHLQNSCGNLFLNKAERITAGGPNCTSIASDSLQVWVMSRHQPQRDCACFGMRDFKIRQTCTSSQPFGNCSLIKCIRLKAWREQRRFDQRLTVREWQTINKMHAARLITAEIHQNCCVIIKTARGGTHMPANKMLQHHIWPLFWGSAVKHLLGWKIYQFCHLIMESHTVQRCALFAVGQPCLTR